MSVTRNSSDVKRFDLRDLSNKLAGKLDNLHRDGRDLKSACPKCGGEDRFFSGANVGYAVFSCRQCGHVEFTDRMLGLDWKTDHSVIKPAKQIEHADVDVGAIRNLYGSLALFAQAELLKQPHAIEYLHKRGISQAEAKRLGLGYIDTRTYEYWYKNIPSERLRGAVKAAGLPTVGNNGRLTPGGARFAGGRMGKIVFPYRNQFDETVDLRTRSIFDGDTSEGKQVRYTSPFGSQAARGVNVFYGADAMGDGGDVALVEGEFKRLTPLALGASTPIVALRGTNDFMDEYIELLRGRRVILAFDNDARKQEGDLTAGSAATINVGRKLKAARIDVMVLPPSRLGKHKGVDDWAFAVMRFGVGAFNALIDTKNLVTLAEFEAGLVADGINIDQLVKPKSDIGTERRYIPVEAVDYRPHANVETVDVDEATAIIERETRNHLRNHRRGNEQLLITAPPGVGKTTTVMQVVMEESERTKETVAVFLPNHSVIDEKIDDGPLAGFQHIYGHNETNCIQSGLVNALIARDYNASAIVCKGCPALEWCMEQGYKSQFVGESNRAYVHAHAHTSLANEKVIVIDEASHNMFIGEMDLRVEDIAGVAQNSHIGDVQRRLLRGLMALYTEPGCAKLEGREFYDVLVRHFDGLYNVESWGDGKRLQEVLDMFVTNARATGNFDNLPRSFSSKLLAIMTDDVRRMIDGEQPTGRIRMSSIGAARRIEIVFNKGGLGQYSNRPVIALNATADAEIMQDLMGPLRVVSPQVAIAEGNVIIQDITLNHAKSGYVSGSPDAQKRQMAWINRIGSRIRAHEGGEEDTAIITTKALEPVLKKAFPKAKIAYYAALEGRNDLQCGLTILANSVPVNIDEVARQACALWPDVDLSLTRSSVAFEMMAAGDELLAVEQLDGVDDRLRRLIWQARDAAAVQAVHRSRIVRQTGRTVVIMFARPIPGIAPTELITEREQKPRANAVVKAPAVDKLTAIAADLVERDGGFSSRTLLDAADMAKRTVQINFDEVARRLGLYLTDMPVSKPLANGGSRTQTMRVALSERLLISASLHGGYHDYSNNIITTVAPVESTYKFVSDGWAVDVAAFAKQLMDDPEIAALVDAELERIVDATPVAVPTMRAVVMADAADDEVELVEDNELLAVLSELGFIMADVGVEVT